MYYVDRHVIDYPYYGYFYQRDPEDTSKPLDQREQTETLVFETECDIQEVSKAANPVLIATFSVFFPFDSEDDIPIRRGMKFQGSMKGIDISGMVTNVVYSQLKGVVCYCKDYDADESY